MFNIANILTAVESFLSKATSIEPEAVAVVDEARKAASAVGILTPERDAAIATEVQRLTGDVASLTPVVTNTVDSLEAELNRGVSLATALAEHVENMSAAGSSGPVTTASGKQYTVAVSAASPTAPAAAPLPQAADGVSAAATAAEQPAPAPAGEAASLPPETTTATAQTT